MMIRLGCPYPSCAAHDNNYIWGHFSLELQAREVTVVRHDDQTGLLLFTCYVCGKAAFKYLDQECLEILSRSLPVREAADRKLPEPIPEPDPESPTVREAGHLVAEAALVSVRNQVATLLERGASRIKQLTQ